MADIPYFFPRYLYLGDNGGYPGKVIINGKAVDAWVIRLNPIEMNGEMCLAMDALVQKPSSFGLTFEELLQEESSWISCGTIAIMNLGAWYNLASVIVDIFNFFHPI